MLRRPSNQKSVTYLYLINCFLNLVPTENVCNGWTDPQEGCPEPVWYADKYCADTNNIGACNYDGGKFVFLLMLSLTGQNSP